MKFQGHNDRINAQKLSCIIEGKRPEKFHGHSNCKGKYPREGNHPPHTQTSGYKDVEIKYVTVRVRFACCRAHPVDEV